MGVQVGFNYQQWVLTYPEFSYVGSDLANEYWTIATIYHRNDGGGPVNIIAQQQVLLNLVTAHIAQLFKVTDGQAESQIVGRIDSASEGSVNVSSQMAELISKQKDWWDQTKYGAAYWAATSVFRTMRYKPGPRRNFNPLFGGGFFGGFIR